MASVYPPIEPGQAPEPAGYPSPEGRPEEPGTEATIPGEPVREGPLGPGYEVLGDINPRVGEPGTAPGGATPPPAGPAVTGGPLSPADERTWAMVSHLGILANLFTGFLGPLVPLIVYLIYKDRSRYVAYQSMQAFIFQLIWWIGASILAIVAWTISGILAAILIGCLLMPLALLVSLIPLAALAYGVYGAIETSQGRDFKYWLIGDWTRELIRIP